MVKCWANLRLETLITAMMLSNSMHKNEVFLIVNISESLELTDFTAFYVSSELQSQKVIEYNCSLKQKPKYSPKVNKEHCGIK